MARLIGVAAVAIGLAAVLWLVLGGDDEQVAGPVTTPYGGTNEGSGYQPEGGLTSEEDTDAQRRAREEAARRAAEEDARRRRSGDEARGVHGSVTDGSGRGVSGATVSLHRASGLWRPGLTLPRALATGRSDASGAFLVAPAPPGGRLVLRAEAAGFAPTHAIVEAPGTRVDLVLDKGGSLEVRVVDMGGKPVVGARAVHTVGGGWEGVQNEATTGEKGVARFAMVPTGAGRLTVSAKGHAAVGLRDVAVAPGEKAKRTVVLGPAQALRGKVLEAATDQPISGAQIEVHYPQLPGVEPSEAVATREDGSFQVQLEVSQGQNYQLRVRHSAYAEARVTRTLNVTDDVEIKLELRGEPLSGLVVDADGRGVGGVRVTYVGLGEEGVPATTTDDDGRFKLSRPEWSLGGATLLAVAPGEGIGTRYVRLKEESSPDRVVLKLSGAGDVTGTVFGTAGEPVAGAQVLLEVDSAATRRNLGGGQNPWQIMNLMRMGEARSRFTAVTDTQGRYLIRGVPEMAYVVRASFGHLTATSEEAVLVMAGVSATADLTLAAGGTIQGWVVDTDERPVPGAHVEARPMNRRGGGAGRTAVQARSQGDGRFELRGVSEGTYRITVSAAGYGTVNEANVEAGTSDLTLRVTQLGWIRGVVEDVRGGPYEGTFRIHVKRLHGADDPPTPDMWWSAGRPHPFNTDDGAFEIRGQQAGDYEVRASTDEGLISAKAASVEVVDGRATPLVRLKLSPGAVLRGRVLDEATGKPIRGAHVSASVRHDDAPRDATGSTSGRTRTNREGHYEIHGLGGGTYLVSVWAEGTTWSQAVEISLGQEKRLDLVRREPGSVRVVVLDSQGSPLEGAMPTLRSETGAVVQPNWNLLRRDGLLTQGPDAWKQATTTGAQGVNVRHHVPPGRYKVSAALQGFELVGEGASVEVFPGREARAEVRLKKAAR